MQSPMMEAELNAFLNSHYQAYNAWLKANVRSLQSRRADRSRLNLFLSWLEQNEFLYCGLDMQKARMVAVAEYIDHLQLGLNARPSTVKKTMLALNQFFVFAGLSPVSVQRHDMPRDEFSLPAEVQQHFLQTALSVDSIKQKAISLLLFDTGMKAEHCSNLDIEDFDQVSSSVTVRGRHDECGKCYSLAPNTVSAILDWLKLRLQKYQRASEYALFVNPQRKRISPAGINLIVRKLGKVANMTVSVQSLRDTYLLSRTNKPAV